MEPPHATRYHGTDLLSAQRHDRIHLIERDTRHALRAEVRDVDVLLGQGLDCERIDVAGLGAGAQEAVSRRGQRTRETFGHLAACGVANAEKQNRYRDLPPSPSMSSAWCLIDLPSTRNTTSSAMLVARSATRSRLRLTRNRSIAAPMMCGSSIMCVRRMRMNRSVSLTSGRLYVGTSPPSTAGMCSTLPLIAAMAESFIGASLAPKSTVPSENCRIPPPEPID